MAGQLRGRACTPGFYRWLDVKHGQQVTKVGVPPLPSKNLIREARLSCAGFFIFWNVPPSYPAERAAGGVTVDGLSGDWSIFRRKDAFCRLTVGRKKDLSPSRSPIVAI
jgi:hypothetical protein